MADSSGTSTRSSPDVQAVAGDGALERLKDLRHDARERVTAVAAWAVDRVFDAPLDIRTGREAEAALLSTDDGHSQQFARRAAGWGAARAARSVGTRYGARLAGRAAAPVGAAVELGLAARSGLRELQVLTSLLVNRLAAAALGNEPEMVRRTILALYLEPTQRPDLAVSLGSYAPALAKRWAINAVPLTGRRQSTLTRRRIEAVERARLADLVADWRRVGAIVVLEATSTPSPTTSADAGPVGELAVGDQPVRSGRVPPPPPPPPPVVSRSTRVPAPPPPPPVS